jgi:hypothetical protein
MELSKQERAALRAELDAARLTARELAHRNGLHVTETAKPAARLSNVHASNRWGCTEKDGSARVSPNGKALRAWRKAPWSEEHKELAEKLGVSPKALQAEISRARKRKAD